MSIVKKITDKAKGVLLGGEPGKNSKKGEARIIGLVSEVDEEKIAELLQAILFLKETGTDPVDFYISTYGGSADDMFCLYDMMNHIKPDMEIRTIGIGKVMSAGVPLLAAGTKGKRKIGKYCRVMLHNVSAGTIGALAQMQNEMKEVEKIQKQYIEILASETNMTEKQIRRLINKNVNVYLSAEEAVELGIADEII